MLREYHCMVAGFPDIVFDEKAKALSVPDFKSYLKEGLEASDYALMEYLFLPYDNQNLLRFLGISKGSFSSWANVSEADFENEVLRQESILPESPVIPCYMTSFIASFRQQKDVYSPVEWENLLSSSFYQYTRFCEEPFIRQWYEWECRCRNIITAITCRNAEIDMEGQIIGEDLFTEQLKKSSHKDFGLSSDFPDVVNLLAIADTTDILERERKLDLLRWQHIMDETVFEYFNIKRIGAFLLQFLILHRWMDLDAETGKLFFRKLVQGIEVSFRNNFSDVIV